MGPTFNIKVTIFIIIILLAVGTPYYSMTEGWSLVDAFYFSGITLTTVGYGDLHPSHDGSKIFTVVYAFFGIGIIFVLLTSMMSYYLSKHHGLIEETMRSYKKIIPKKRWRTRY